MVRMVLSGSTSLTALLEVSATKTSPTASTATPDGAMKPEPMVRMVPSGSTSLTALLPESIVVARVGVKVGSVEYWNSAVVVEPCGLTVPLSVASVPELAMTAAPVTTNGAAGVKRISSASSWGRQRRWALRTVRGVLANRRGFQDARSIGNSLIVWETDGRAYWASRRKLERAWRAQ